MSDEPSPPSPERARSEQLFEAVCDLPPEARAPYLDDQCAGDPRLRAEVESLLSYDARDPDFMGEPVRPVELEGATIGLPESGQVGPYRLLELVGTGGFGEVYLAEQEEPVRRQIALKLIKPGMDSRNVLARFEAERQALALMDHPGIAKVLDAGTTSLGRPYFVMEYIRGVPITDYCDEHRLDLRARLELFDPVCRAIQHAHHKGVIHRDIKPSNVLVGERDGEPVPVVIDFGIAKALDRPLTDSTQVTELGQFLGTPEYISPEQADLTSLDIDTRTDVYSLGVLLYQLLTGTTPFDRRSLKRIALDEVRRVIREEDPPKPSTRVGHLDGDIDAVTTARRSEIHTLIRAFRGDLDWIAMKCLEKDRTRRYDSPSALADDVLRYLRNEPVTAGPPDLYYRAKKFVLRNRVAVTFGALMLITIVTGAGLALDGYLVASTERDHAQQEERKAKAIQTFFVDRMLEAASPFFGGTPATSVREVMDKASREVHDAFPDDPEVRASVLDTMARSYQTMGLFGEAERHADLALEAMAEAGLSGETRISALVLKTDAIRTSGRLDVAEPLAREVLSEARATLPPDHELVHRADSVLGLILWRKGHFDEALALAEPLVERLTAVEGAAAKPTLSARNLVAMIRRGQGRNEEAVALYRAIEADSKVTHGPDHPFTLLVQNNLGVALGKAGKRKESEDLARQVWMKRRVILGETHPHTLGTLSNLARTYHVRGAYAEAEALTREAYGYQREALGATNFEVLRTYRELGETIRRQGRLDEAEGILRECLRETRSQLDDHPDTVACLEKLGKLCLERKHPEEAAELFREGLARSLRLYQDRVHSDTRTQEEGLIEALTQLGRTAELHALRIEQIERREAAGRLPDAEPALLDWIAEFRVTTEFEDLRDPGAALDWAKRAVERTEEKNPYFLRTLARALRANDRIPETFGALEKAVAVMPADATELAGSLTEILAELEADPAAAGELVPAIGSLREAVQLKAASGTPDDESR